MLERLSAIPMFVGLSALAACPFDGYKMGVNSESWLEDMVGLGVLPAVSIGAVTLSSVLSLAGYHGDQGGFVYLVVGPTRSIRPRDPA